MSPWLIILISLSGVFAALQIAARLAAEPRSINDNNPFLNPSAVSVLPEDMRFYAEAIGESARRSTGVYEKIIKRILDLIVSFLGLVFLSPLFVFVIVWIKIDDPGPAFFTQKRVGKGKSIFFLHKFRTMKMATPHDTPTHMLDNPSKYITKSGKFLRKSSLDELPQLWDVFRGKMSLIGPRPALWNQADLIAERDKYSANDAVPGLTGLAQINGRDELEIADKARLDGVYCQTICFATDIKCFLGTVKSVVKSNGIVEGGTGELHKKRQDK